MDLIERNDEIININQQKNHNYIKNIDEYKQLYRQSIENRQNFWSDLAKNFYWKESEENNEKHNTIIDYNFDINSGKISTDFMKSSKTNVCYNLIDRNIDLGFGNRIAYHWVGHEFNLKYSLTYSELKEKVCKFANVLKDFGLEKGDTIVHYLPDLLETVISMLACSRLGLVYANTFTGYSAQCLAERMVDLKCKLLITSDVYYSYKKFINLKIFSDEAIKICNKNNHKIKARIFIKYLSNQNYGLNTSDYMFELDKQLDHWWHQLIETAEPDCPPVWLNSEEPLFVIFSSGTTGKQKAIVHTNGGFMLMSATVFKYSFNYSDGDILYCAGCLGWITGQYSHVYGSLANAATVVLSDGSQTHPTPGRWWRIIDEYKVNIFYVNPTSIRTLRTFGDSYVNEFKMNDLKVIGVVGETIDIQTWKWLFEVVGRKRCPIVDTYFQSETGCPIIFAIPYVMPMKPGSVSLPFFGIEPVIVDENGRELNGECRGTLLIKSGWPSITRTLYNDYKLYEKTYFQKYPKYYFTGDGAIRDKDGFIHITGRVDDMINKYSLLISTAEVESAILDCDLVSEVAAVPIPDPITGHHICCFVVMKEDNSFNDDIESLLKQKVNEKIGIVAIPKYIYSVRALPKNRSSKIMRQLLAKIVKNEDILTDNSTVSDLTIINEIKQIFQK